jgi:diamine N-acetyltransferase
MEVRLEPTTRENWMDALKLRVRDEQEHFVPSVAVSIAKVHIKPDGDDTEYLPFNVNHSDDQLVGFVMIAFEEKTDWCYWMNGFLIDQQFQGKGYGKATIKVVAEMIRKRFPHSKCMNLTVRAENASARRLYETCGFVETGDVYDGEVVYRLLF